MGLTTHQPVPDGTSPRPGAPSTGAAPANPTQDNTQAIMQPSRLRRTDRDDKKNQLVLPKSGEDLYGFQLKQELGRGAFARVFLAEQGDLAGRPVVLKVSSISGNEPQTLAQLQHTHIVPIYSVHEDAERGLRAVCMPYYGGASLSAVLQALFGQTPRPLHGADFVAALRLVRGPAVVPRTAAQEAEGPPPDEEVLDHLNKLSYLRTVAWVVARLADAVHHAHQRGVLHRDIKPSNVLIGSDGQPMLLDFNVAQNVNSLQTQAKIILGGTVAYMAPEQLRAVAQRSATLALQVSRQADLYSLGMVLYEMIAGNNPFDLSGSYSPVVSQLEVMAQERSRAIPSLRQHRNDVPWGLESIARRCLAPDPAQRYQYGEELAEDLRRFLEDRPLRHAPELSWVERGQKWLRRHPRLTSSAAVAGVAGLLLLGSGVALAAVVRNHGQTRQELRDAQAQERKRTYEQGATKALCLVNTLVNVQDHLGRGVKVCEETLATYGVLDRADWQDGPDWQALPADQRVRLAEDTRELLLLLAGARVRIADPKEQSAIRAALALLDRAEAIRDLGPSRALWQDRADYLGRLGDETASQEARAQAQALQPAGAREHYLLAAAQVRTARSKQDYQTAIDLLTTALRLDDRYYWAWVQRGICHYERGDLTAAAADFGVCVGQWPQFAWGYYNRGYVLDRSGAKAAALADYGAALERDPRFILPHVSRGLLHLEQRRFAEALADLDQARALGQDDATLHAGRGAALEGLRRGAAADAAFATALGQLATTTPDVATHVRLLYGFAVASRRPDEARRAFAAVPPTDPRHAQALYGLALVETEQGQLDKAIQAFDRALEANPAFAEARRFRAILRARMGDIAGASQDINWCLEREPQSGATLYAAACVAARALERTADPSAARQAIFFLESAFALGYGRDRAAQDPDLAALRTLDEFQRLLR